MDAEEVVSAGKVHDSMTELLLCMWGREGGCSQVQSLVSPFEVAGEERDPCWRPCRAAGIVDIAELKGH